MIDRAKLRARETHSVIEKSCNKLMVGKTYWKCGALPGILKGAELMNFTKNQVGEIQKMENRVYRVIFGAAGTTPISAMRGEIGASLMESRMIKNRILFTKNLKESENELVKNVLGKVMRDRKSKWRKKTEEYLRKVEIRYEELEGLSKYMIKKKVKDYDTRIWKRDLEDKSTLFIYRTYKEAMREETFYKNGEASRLIFRARTNTMALNDRFRHDRGDIRRCTNCSICAVEYEDLGHFLLRCERLDGERDRVLLREMRGRNDTETLGNLLFGGGRWEEVGRMLCRMWRARKCWMNRLGTEGGAGGN